MRIGLLAGALVLLAAPAMAADLGSFPPPVVKAPVAAPAPVFSWTGFYIGGNASYSWGSGTGAGDGLGVNPDGWLAGGQVGYNYQLPNNFVLGVEADVAGGDISGSAGGVTSKLDALGTVRGRLGYAVGRLMPYATAGFAWGSNSIDALGTSSSNTHTGWTAGAGLEYALTDHWTAKAEYLYTDLGTKFYDSVGADAGVTAQSGRLGVNYKF